MKRLLPKPVIAVFEVFLLFLLSSLIRDYFADPSLESFYGGKAKFIEELIKLSVASISGLILLFWKKKI